MSQDRSMPKKYEARWYQRAGIWIGIGINPASITLGAGFASRVPTAALTWLVPIGVFLLTGLAVLAGVIGRRRREPFATWSGATFGVGLGAILINLMMALGMSGWSGFQMGLAGSGLANLLSTSNQLGSILMTAIIFVLALFGINRWNIFAWATTLSSLVLACLALFTVLGRTAQLYETEPFTFGVAVWVVSSVVAYASLFALRSTDFTWDLKSDIDIVLDGLAFFVTLNVSLWIGIWLYQTTGSWDLAQILAGTPIAILGHLFLVLSLLSPALSSLHSGALAFQHVFPFSYAWGRILLLAIGLTLGVLRFDLQLLAFLEWLGAILPPAMAVMIVAAMWQHRLSPKKLLMAWLVGAAVAVSVKLSGQIVHLAAGTAASLLAMYLLQLFTDQQESAVPS